MYDFSNWHYEREHGKAPRGRGFWAFEDNSGHTWYVDETLTLTEAKRKATAMLKAEGVDPLTPIYVAP